MAEQSPDAGVRFALYELQRYLSDELPPMMAVDSVDLLLKTQPEVVASLIQGWAAAQYGRTGANVPVSDYLFHSLKRIHDMSELALLEAEPVRTYVEDLGRILLEFCPQEDREAFWANLSGLGAIEAALTSRVEIVHRLVRNGDASARSAEDSPARPPRVRGAGTGPTPRGLALLMQRLARDTRAGGDSASDYGDRRSELLTQILATAAIRSGTETELERHLRPLAELGVDAEMGQVFRALGRSLPEWALNPATAGATPAASRSDRTVDAMRRIISMASDEKEGTKRFGEMVEAAIEQFNAGSLVRAATIFDLAEQVVKERKLTPELLNAIRKQGRDSLAADQLRRFAERPETHALLRTVLNFFPGLTVHGLLTDLEDEPRRDRRKLLLALLESHGAPARHAALERLHSYVNREMDPNGFFRRNLVFLLRRIPGPADAPVEEELNLLEQTSKMTEPLLLVRESISALGQFKREGAEPVLTTRLAQIEQMLMMGETGVHRTQDLTALLDRVISALANLGSSKALRTIMDHALKRKRALGNTVARLELLAGHDLSGDKDLVAHLVETLRGDLPIKVLGIVVKHEHRMVGSLIRALSATSAPAVREVMEEIVQRFPGRDFASAASKVLSGFGAMSRPVEAPAETLSGEVELFGLPNLFQVLGESRLTGVLTLTDRAGAPIGTVSFEGGQIRECATGALRGKAAFYQLFERPVRGTFAFQSQREASRDGKAGESLLDVLPMVVEGVRRHDEFREAKILVPENARLSATLTQPTPPDTDEEPGFVEAVWIKASSGVPPALLEDALGVDSYRVRHLLAHWVEEGALKPK